MRRLRGVAHAGGAGGSDEAGIGKARRGGPTRARAMQGWRDAGGRTPAGHPGPAMPYAAAARTSLPGFAPVSSPFSKIGTPEQMVMS
jgi:hypothetical protein